MKELLAAGIVFGCMAGQPAVCRDLFTDASHSLSFPMEPFGVKLLHVPRSVPR